MKSYALLLALFQLAVLTVTAQEPVLHPQTANGHLHSRNVRMDSLREVHRHRIDSITAQRYYGVKVDTTYIRRPSEKWTLKLRINTSGSGMDARGLSGSSRFHSSLQADFRNTLSISAAYRGLAAGIAFNPAHFKGQNNSFEFNMNSYANRYGFDIVYSSNKTYNGTIDRDGLKAHINRGDLYQQQLNINGYYAFNYRRFSFPAAFSQSYIQRRSAGSWLLGLSYQWNHINADSVSGKRGAVSLRMHNFAIGGGYGYNFIPHRRILIHMSLLPTMILYSHITMFNGPQRVHLNYKIPEIIVTGRGAFIYSWKHCFIGSTVVYNYSRVGDEDKLLLRSLKWRVRTFWGIRF